jgi:hypothetical protein
MHPCPETPRYRYLEVLTAPGSTAPLREPQWIFGRRERGTLRLLAPAFFTPRKRTTTSPFPCWSAARCPCPEIAVLRLWCVCVYPEKKKRKKKVGLAPTLDLGLILPSSSPHQPHSSSCFLLNTSITLTSSSPFTNIFFQFSRGCSRGSR